MRNHLWLIPALAAAVAVAGCGKEQMPGTTPADQTPRTPGGSPAGSALTPADLDRVRPAAQPLKLALVVKTRNNPFFDPMIRAAEAEAKALGVELEVQSPAQETDKEQQFAIVQNVAATGIKALLVTPADSRGIVPALKQAVQRGAIVVNLDNRVDAEAARAAGLELAAYVGADNEAGGRLAGEEMVKALGGKGRVAILEGIRGADNAEARRRGFQSAVQGKLEVVSRESAEWDTAKAYAKFQSVLAAHKDLDGVFCANDKMALGALKAIQEAGRQGRITVIGYDNIPDVQPYLQNGELHATIEQHPDLMGKYGVRLAVGILGGSTERGRELLVPLEVIRGTR